MLRPALPRRHPFKRRCRWRSRVSAPAWSKADCLPACFPGGSGGPRNCRRNWGTHRPACSPRNRGRRCIQRCRSWRPPRRAAGPCRSIRNWAAVPASSDYFDAVHFNTLIALARRVTNALIGFHHLHARAPKRTGMEIDVAAAIVGHHKTEALLVVEELDLAFDHGAGGCIMVAITPAAAAAVTAATAEAVAAAAELARAARGRFRC